jgi:lincosamide nucleotidyltransferase A/C/D/E
MGSDDATEILDRLAARGIEVWVDGGSGVDALLGEQTRAHDDLDLVIARGDCPAVQDALEPPGFEQATDIEPGLPARLAVRDPGDRRVDINPVVFDQAGDGWQELPAGSWGQYPADGLGGVGTIAGRPVRCLAPELQVRHHLGYEPDADDHHDMHRLAERFWLELPPGDYRLKLSADDRRTLADQLSGREWTLVIARSHGRRADTDAPARRLRVARGRRVQRHGSGNRLVELLAAQADVVQPPPRGSQRPLGAMAGDVNVVSRVIPAVDGLDGVRVGAGAGDRLIGMRVLDAHAQLLLAQTAAGPRELLLVGQLDAESALGRGSEQRPVIVEGRIDVDSDAHGRARTRNCPDRSKATRVSLCTRLLAAVPSGDLLVCRSRGTRST